MASTLCKACPRRDSRGMFRFPSKLTAANKWKLALKIPEEQSVSSWYVCYQHFPKENIEATLKVSYSLVGKDGE